MVFYFADVATTPTTASSSSSSHHRYREALPTAAQNPEYDQIYLPEDFGYPDVTGGPPPPVQQMPPAGSGGRSYENYDPKYNIYENPEEEAAVDGGVDDVAGGVGSGGSPTGRVKYARPNVSGTLLVIGIICVVIIAIILIIVIVLKMRTTEEASLKVTESKSFQAEGEVGVAATTSAVSTTGATNGVHSTKVVRTSNNNNKPVKEWYV